MLPCYLHGSDHTIKGFRCHLRATSRHFEQAIEQGHFSTLAVAKLIMAVNSMEQGRTFALVMQVESTLR